MHIFCNLTDRPQKDLVVMYRSFCFVGREMQTNPAFGAKTGEREAAAPYFVVAFSWVTFPTEAEIIL